MDAAIVGAAASRAFSGPCQPPDRRPWYVRRLASALDFRILGPLDVLDGERELRLGGVKQRSVLAIMLLHAGEAVSSDRLVEELWGEDPPADGQTALQQHVSRLRKQLEPHSVLVTRAPGYALEIDPAQLDLERFRALRARGREALREGRWVANPIAGTLTHVDPETTRIVRTIELDGIPRSIALADDVVWVALAHGATAATTSEVEGVTTFQTTTCERPLAGRDGGADVLITSDLPLQGGTRISATQMTQAIEFVLRERGFRAGRHRVAYQSCDDSVASTALFDEAKCAANARAYAQNANVVGVIGTMNSPCAVVAVPELNRADGGALAMVSPLNSFVGLTRHGPGVDPALPAALYPTGTRSFLRVYPTDDLEGAALALFARDAHAERVFVLDDGEPAYGALQATAFETAAGQVGLDVVGRESWDPRATRYEELARRVAASGASAVYVGGLVDTNAARVIRDLRSQLGRSVILIGPSGLSPIPQLVKKSRRAAIGMYVAFAGILTEGLPPEGAHWATRFAATQRGAEVGPEAIYTAQAAEVLLDAIARSDGTRASVLEELFRTNERGGLLGNFGFDRNGDISESPVTILRVERPGTSNTIMSVEGATIARVVRPSPRLVAVDE